MNYETYAAWAAKKHVPAKRAEAVFAAAQAAASAFSRTDPRHWSMLKAKLHTELGSSPSVLAEDKVRRLTALAQHLKALPGIATYTDDGQFITLHYTRDATTGLALPFNDYCDCTITYDPQSDKWTSAGVLFGSTVVLAETVEPGMFFMQSLMDSSTKSALMRDFFQKAQKTCLMYGAHNMNNFVFHLQILTRNLGTIDYTPGEGPNYAHFYASSFPFDCWFSMAKIGAGTIKFVKDINASGYMLSPRTFQQFTAALDDHVLAQQSFTRTCIGVLQ
jgi:hypothetical protein